MRPTAWLSCALLVLALAGCGGGNEGSADPDSLTSSDDHEEGLVDTRRRDHEAVTPAVAAQPSERPLVAFVRIGAGEAEDGAGNVVTAPQRIAVDLDAHAFPPRALDPVLDVGSLRFVHYAHPRPGVLRFVVEDVTKLAIGAELAVHYEGDDASRRVVIQAITEADLHEVTP